MEEPKRCFVHCRSGRVAGTLTHLLKSRRSSPKHTRTNVTRDCTVNLSSARESLENVLKKRQCSVIIRNSTSVQKIFDGIEANGGLSKFRKRKYQNYAETSTVDETPNKYSSAKDIDTNKKHVPVYKQLNVNDKQEEPHGEVKSDLYEFDSDSENARAKKRCKIRISADESAGFEKYIDEFMHAIDRNFKRNVKKKKKNNNTLKRKRVAVNDKTSGKLFVQNSNGKLGNNQLVNDKIELAAACKQAGADGNLQMRTRASDNTTENSVILETNAVVEQSRNAVTSRCAKVSDIFDEISKNIAPVDSVRGINVADNKIMTKEGEKIQTLNGVDDDDNSDFFGFSNEDIDSDSNRVDINRINIISDVLIDSAININYNELEQPNANSTMIVNRRTRQHPSTPWRPNLGITRNPYLLQIKNTLLPNYNQEMIINSSISEKSLTRTTNNAVTPDAQRRLYQTNILDFMSTDKENDCEALQQCSLFDCNDLSPIKTRTEKVSSLEDKENYKTSTVVKRLNRDALGGAAFSNRALQNLTNQNFQSHVSSHDDLENLFGFESLSEDKENNVVVPAKKPAPVMKSYFSKPVRLDVVTKTLPKENGCVMTNDRTKEKSSSDDADEQQGSMKLFEDLEDTTKDYVRPIKKYEPRRLKRQRVPSHVSDDIDDEIENAKHKKKNVRTREEEKEYERWAAAFNSMCQEVDQYTLNIE